MKVRFGWFLAVLVMGLSLVGCPPIEEIPELPIPDVSEGEIPTEEVPDIPIPEKPEEGGVIHPEPFWANYEVQASFFDEDGLLVGEPEEILLGRFIPAENGPVQLDFISTASLVFSSIQIDYRLKNGESDYLNILSGYWGGRGKNNSKNTPFWYDETECHGGSAHLLVPFSVEILSAKVSVSWYYTDAPWQAQSFDCTLLSPDDLDQDHLLDAWENSYDCFSEANQEANPVMYGPWGFPDGDSLSNQDEMSYGTNPCLADTDGDGFSDSDEIRDWLGTNPNDINDHPPVNEEGEPGKG